MKLSTIGITLLILVVITFAIVFFLYPSGPTQLPKANETGSTPEGIKEIVNVNNQFALDLYSELSKTEEGNIFYSPYSLFSALAMTYEGANAQTAEEIKSVLHFPDYNVLRPNFAALYNTINTHEGSFELSTANALWVQQDYQLLDDYLTAIKNYYGGNAANLDFEREPEKSRQIINDFIEERTNNKIKNLLPRGSLDNSTRVILTNAIYFKGYWEWKFKRINTRKRDFKTPTGVKKVLMMYMESDKAKFNYAETSDLQILELPYKNDKLSMLILLPKEDIESIEPLTIEKLSEYKNLMKKIRLDEIYIPKFEVNTGYSMKKLLKSLGISTPFSPEEANFSRMTEKEDLFIFDMFHKAYVKVDEQGTEAAAATAISFTFTSAAHHRIFKADHPFIFIIQEKDTGAILFMGRIMDPSE